MAEHHINYMVQPQGRLAASVITAVDQNATKKSKMQDIFKDLQISKSTGFNMPIHLVS